MPTSPLRSPASPSHRPRAPVPANIGEAAARPPAQDCPAGHPPGRRVALGAARVTWGRRGATAVWVAKNAEIPGALVWEAKKGASVAGGVGVGVAGAAGAAGAREGGAAAGTSQNAPSGSASPGGAAARASWASAVSGAGVMGCAFSLEELLGAVRRAAGAPGG